MDKLYINNILKQLENPCQINCSEGFAYAKACSNLISEKQYAIARKLAIRVLNHWHEMDRRLYPVWSELMETLGFYPYLRDKEKGLETIFVADLQNPSPYSPDRAERPINKGFEDFRYSPAYSPR